MANHFLVCLSVLFLFDEILFYLMFHPLNSLHSTPLSPPHRSARRSRAHHQGFDGWSSRICTVEEIEAVVTKDDTGRDCITYCEVQAHRRTATSAPQASPSPSITAPQHTPEAGLTAPLSRTEAWGTGGSGTESEGSGRLRQQCLEVSSAPCFGGELATSSAAPAEGLRLKSHWFAEAVVEIPRSRPRTQGVDHRLHVTLVSRSRKLKRSSTKKKKKKELAPLSYTLLGHCNSQ